MGEKALVSGACVGLYASVFVSVTSNTCLKAPRGFPPYAGWRLNSLTWPMRPCVSIPPARPLHALYPLPVTLSLVLAHHTSRAILLPSLSGAQAGSDCPHPDRLSQKPVLGHHRYFSLVCTCPRVTIKSLSGFPTRKGTSSGEDRIC